MGLERRVYLTVSPPVGQNDENHRSLPHNMARLQDFSMQNRTELYPRQILKLDFSGAPPGAYPRKNISIPILFIPNLTWADGAGDTLFGTFLNFLTKGLLIE
jgi:hypothetical protein